MKQVISFFGQQIFQW